VAEGADALKRLPSSGCRRSRSARRTRSPSGSPRAPRRSTASPTPWRGSRTNCANGPRRRRRRSARSPRPSSRPRR
jgi:hypothetical protein